MSANVKIYLEFYRDGGTPIAVAHGKGEYTNRLKIECPETIQPAELSAALREQGVINDDVNLEYMVQGGLTFRVPWPYALKRLLNPNSDVTVSEGETLTVFLSQQPQNPVSKDLVKILDED